jgi:hypothetical protein
VFGCSVPEPEVPLFGAFVKAPAQRGRSEVIGLIYNIAIEDDPFVRQMIATPDLPEAYIQDQRVNRQVPIEVSVLAIGYRNGGGFTHDLPPQPPITLDRISPCDAAEIAQFTKRLDYLRLILFAPDVPADELIAVSLRFAADCQPAEDHDRFLRNAGRELAKMLNRDLARLEKLLKRLKT